jgi:hypothetical protein
MKQITVAYGSTVFQFSLTKLLKRLGLFGRYEQVKDAISKSFLSFLRSLLCGP